MFAFLAQGGGSPQIFGNGRMAVYNNLRAGVPNQQFYLAQVDKQTGSRTRRCCSTSSTRAMSRVKPRSRS